MAAENIETIVSLAKRRGFVFPASDIYGGLGSSWDYGQLGVELANNIKKSWWNWLVYERDDVEGIDSSREPLCRMTRRSHIQFKVQGLR